MREIALWTTSTLAALGVLFGYSTSTGHTKDSLLAASVTATSTTSPSETSSGTRSSRGGGSSSSSSSPSSSSSSASSGTSGTYTGDAVMTQFGNVQVQITVKNGKVVTADAIQAPDQNGRDQAINAVAVPQLNAAAVQAQSANIDLVSGASYTSQGYITSLQSALDQAHL